ncbi:MAG: hypothetical protein JXM69_02455 [Anaerolineae bacterium]|nr:hypothetical protein [Anaerolineae bacterium]
MSVDEIIQAKIYRLQELKKYQSYYGPNTPYPVVVEINELEAELRQLLGTQTTRPTAAVKKTVKKRRRNQPPAWQFWRMSQATMDAVATIAFIGLVFLLGSIVFAAYMQTRPEAAIAAYPADGFFDGPPPTLRPTFTPTSSPNGSNLPVAEAALAGDIRLPSPNQEPTAVPTPVPTLTPSAIPTDTPTPLPTDTAVPTNTPPPPPTSTPAPPTPTPEPSFPFMVGEQGNRMFQKTTYHVINIYAAAVTADNVPIGGLKLVGDHVPSGAHAESGPSVWDWSVVNCLDCDYIKQGNLKFEPGSFTDGTWNVYLANQDGAQLSPVVPLNYSADPEQWVWDFIIFKKK